MNLLTSRAQGNAGEMLFAIVAVLGSRGVIKAGVPVVDDEGRDVEIQLGGRFRAAFAIQVKTTIAPLRRHRRHLELFTSFQIPVADMVDHPTYWYFLAHIDVRLLRFSDYVFLIPSREVHAHVRAKMRRGEPCFTFQGSMDANAHDRWTPYRLNVGDLGRRLVKLMRDAPPDVAESAALAALTKMSGICLLGTAPGSVKVA